MGLMLPKRGEIPEGIPKVNSISPFFYDETLLAARLKRLKRGLEGLILILPTLVFFVPSFPGKARREFQTFSKCKKVVISSFLKSN